MNEIILPSLKLLFKPLIMYNGEWELGEDLANISIVKNDKNLFQEFLDRYYYMPLKVIFKDESLIKSFGYGICSRRLPNGVRTLYFSKRAFLRNVISNIDEIVEQNGEDVYKAVKKAIRGKKDIYRDVEKQLEESEYYELVKNEYLSCELDITLEEFITLCKKKYTKLLNGYNTVMDLFDKSLNIDKLIDCFDPNQLYLFTAYSLLKNSEKYYEMYGRLDYSISSIDSYREVVKEVRKSDNFYNSHITINVKDDLKVYTIDDLFKEYDELLKRANG